MWEDKSAVWQLLNKINNLIEDNEYLRSMIDNLTDRVRRLEESSRNNNHTDYFNYIDNLQSQITEVRNSIPAVNNVAVMSQDEYDNTEHRADTIYFTQWSYNDLANAPTITANTTSRATIYWSSIANNITIWETPYIRDIHRNDDGTLTATYNNWTTETV